MKKYKLLNLTPLSRKYLFVFLIILFSGCQNSQIVSTLPVERTNQLLPTQTMTSLLVASKTIVMSATPIITRTQTSIPISTNTQTSIPTSTNTPKPTLEINGKAKYLNQLFSNNKNCLLPCWLGITPGSSTWEDMVNIFSPFSPLSLDSSNEPYLANRQIKKILQEQAGDNLDPDFFLSGQVVDAITLTAEIHNNSDTVQKLDIFMNYYSMSNLSSLNQPPDRVLLQTSTARFEKGAPWEYDFWIIYDHIGILAHYQYADIYISSKDDNTISICPRYDGLKNIFMDLSSTGIDRTTENDNFISYYLGKGWNIHHSDQTRFHYIEDVSDLTPQTFYEKVIKGGKCFETPKKFWY